MKKYLSYLIVAVIIVVVIGMLMFAKNATGRRDSQSSAIGTEDPLPPGAMARDTTVAPTPPR